MIVIVTYPLILSRRKGRRELTRSRGRVSKFLHEISAIVSDLSYTLPIWIVAFSSLGTLILLVAFGWIGRGILIASLSIGMYLSARNVFEHHDLKFGRGLSDREMREARDYVISIFQGGE